LAFALGPPVSDGVTTKTFGLGHAGTDIAAPLGTPVFPIAGGLVAKTAYSGTAGNYVVITHIPGIESRYLHLDSINVRTGSSVTRSEVIGSVGSTGKSTGPHLHLEIRVCGVPLPAGLILIPGRLVKKLYSSLGGSL
jgi:murein DD-endopeptidase MepM/ murein hydrolase activator NlpD